MRLHYNHNLNATARTLRQAGNLSEALLWREIKNKKLGYQFLRQRPICKYVVDFFCSRLNLVIEVDGISHDSKVEEDIFRQRFLESKDIHFLRFQDSEVKNNLESVVREIERNIKILERKSSVLTNSDTSFIKGGIKIPSLADSAPPLEKGENPPPRSRAASFRKEE